jgi:hypothetical protein
MADLKSPTEPMLEIMGIIGPKNIGPYCKSGRSGSNHLLEIPNDGTISAFWVGFAKQPKREKRTPLPFFCKIHMSVVVTSF